MTFRHRNIEVAHVCGCWLLYLLQFTEVTAWSLEREEGETARVMLRSRNRTVAPLPSHPNVTIFGAGLSAVVYVPDSAKGYYRSSRYDWGSMVGRVQLEVPNGGGNVTIFTDARPRPHRPLLSDHVLGLAAEFGCGVRGTMCTPGHGHKLLATNGVLGYGDAGRSGTFLKLGVGKLLRPYAYMLRLALEPRLTVCSA